MRSTVAGALGAALTCSLATILRWQYQARHGRMDTPVPHRRAQDVAALNSARLDAIEKRLNAYDHAWATYRDATGTPTRPHLHLVSGDTLP